MAQTHDAPLRPRRQDRDCTWLFIYRPFRGPCFRSPTPRLRPRCRERALAWHGNSPSPSFRGTEYNIAYRKQAFLRNKGFARSLNLHYGDDDIFISEIVRPGNTAVELSDESIVKLRRGNHPRLFTERVLRRIFTESHIRRRPRFLFGLLGWLRIIAILTALAAAYICYPNMQAATIAGVMLLTMFTLDIAMWRPAMKAMKSRPLLITIPWLSITYPLRRSARKIRSKLGKQKKYTWD